MSGARSRRVAEPAAEALPAWQWPTGTPTGPRVGDDVVRQALAVLARRLRRPGAILTRPEDVGAWLRLHLAEAERELFLVLYLDNRHRLIAHELQAVGTIDGATVHPREVVRLALRHNACAVILAHNHPSGSDKPSAADSALTLRVREALALVDVRLLDHFIIPAGAEPVSLADRGLM
jgi:DNA repair protein RadC